MRHIPPSIARGYTAMTAMTKLLLCALAAILFAAAVDGRYMADAEHRAALVSLAHLHRPPILVNQHVTLLSATTTAAQSCRVGCCGAGLLGTRNVAHNYYSILL